MKSSPNSPQLIFVYNAQSGKWNALLDSIHKTFSPSTYNCSLCAITYDSIGMKKEWKTFLNELPLSSMFYHRDEWLKKTQRNDNLPAVFLKRKNKEIQLIIEAERLKQMSLSDLKAEILKKTATD